LQLGFFFYQTRCSGCQACVLACRQWHNESDDALDYITILEKEGGKFPEVHVRWLFLSCFHCQNPPCIRICPVRAIYKRPEDGIVIVDPVRCVGKEECGAPCMQACPYDAPKFLEEAGAKMEKCDGCLDRLQEGKAPICVAACPLHALEFGAMSDWEASRGAAKEIEGFRYLARVGPSIAFKPKGL